MNVSTPLEYEKSLSRTFSSSNYAVVSLFLIRIFMKIIVIVIKNIYEYMGKYLVLLYFKKSLKHCT